MPDEDNALGSGLSIEIFPKPMGAKIPIEDINIHIGIDFLYSQSGL